MRARWLADLRPFSLDPALALAEYEALAAAYTAPDRYYHNLAHIQTALTFADRLLNLAEQTAVVLLALWFHDIIYLPGAEDNERRSADYAVAAISRLALPEALIEPVRTAILATTHNQPTPLIDVQIVLDADLGTLGSDFELYIAYSDRIRQEYAFVPLPEYKNGRITLLQKLLTRPRIFQTAPMYAQREAQARQNIQREIDQLSAI